MDYIMLQLVYFSSLDLTLRYFMFMMSLANLK